MDDAMFSGECHGDEVGDEVDFAVLPPTFFFLGSLSTLHCAESAKSPQAQPSSANQCAAWSRGDCDMR